MENNGGARPTGCSNCFRPGHWAKDCTLPPRNPNPSYTTNTNNNFTGSSSSSKPSEEKPTTEKTKGKRVLKPKPKLTPSLLTSNEGLGYILRHFPKSFKFRGRGHEASDLESLIGLYREWHSQLLPYYSFDQFVQKVEQVGATRHVRTCVRELKERVANGGDPSKLHEPPVEHNEPNLDSEETNILEDPVLDKHDDVDMHEELLDDVYEKATAPEQHESPSQVQITDEQKARMEANRLKALERAAARASKSQTSVKELGERVSNEGEPSKLHEPPAEHIEANPGPAEEDNMEEPNHDTGDPMLDNIDDADIQEELINDAYGTATTEQSESSQAQKPVSVDAQEHPDHASLKKSENGSSASSIQIQFTDEQKARIEVNRLKALEKAATRSSSSSQAV